MNNEVFLDKLIDCIIDYKDAYSKSKTINNRPERKKINLSVQIGLDRKNKLQTIADENNLKMSEATRCILDEYFDCYFGNDNNIKLSESKPCITPRDNMKKCN